MAIQIGGSTVIDNSSNITNIANITASGTINGGIIASQAQAEAGTDNTKLMTPLRVAQAITQLGGNVINRIQRGSTSVVSTVPTGAAGVVNVPIIAVNADKAILTQGCRGNITYTGIPDGTGGSSYLAATGSASARYTSTTNVRINSGDSPASASFPAATNSATVDWEAIEFK